MYSGLPQAAAALKLCGSPIWHFPCTLLYCNFNLHNLLHTSITHDSRAQRPESVIRLQRGLRDISAQVFKRDLKGTKFWRDLMDNNKDSFTLEQRRASGINEPDVIKVVCKFFCKPEIKFTANEKFRQQKFLISLNRF